MRQTIKTLGIDYFVIGNLYLSGKGRRFKVVDKMPELGMVLFESIEPVVSQGKEVEGHRMGLKLPQCHNFTQCIIQ